MDENNFTEEELDDLLNSINLEDIDKISYDQLNEYFGFDISELEREAEEIENPKMDFNYQKISENAIDPIYAYPTDSGFDLHSTEDVWLFPMSRALVPTGLKFDIPSNYELQIRSKSGLALKQGLMVLNSPGTVDQGYTGEVKVIMFNTTNEKIKVVKGQKIAQGVLAPVVSGQWINLNPVENLENKDRSDNGFGSTGI